MQVRAKRTHYNGALRVEGAVFEHNGPLHSHIESVKTRGQQASKPTPPNPPATTADSTAGTGEGTTGETAGNGADDQ